MALRPGGQELLIMEATPGAGTTSKHHAVQTDAILVSLWVNTIELGSTLDVTVYTLTDTGKEVVLLSFPQITSPTTDLVIRKSGVTMPKFRVEATYTGEVYYEVYVKAIDNSGVSSVSLQGTSTFKVSQVNVTTSAVELIPSALTDRAGILIKNWSDTGNIYIAETLAKANSATGFPLAPKDALAIDIAAGVSIYAVAGSGVIDVRIGEA